MSGGPVKSGWRAGLWPAGRMLHTSAIVDLSRDCLSGRTGSSIGTTLNSTESGSLRVRSQVAAGTKYGEFSSREKSYGFSPEER